jgi:hypothetical protein
MVFILMLMCEREESTSNGFSIEAPHLWRSPLYILLHGTAVSLGWPRRTYSRRDILLRMRTRSCSDGKTSLVSAKHVE